MLARYFFRVALIVAAVLSMVQPARADGVLSAFSTNIQSCYVQSWGDSFNQFSGGSADACRVGWVTMKGYISATFTGDVRDVTASLFKRTITVQTFSYAAPDVGYTMVFSFMPGQSCPVNSTGTFPTCTCSANYSPSATSFVCESAAPPPPTTCTAYPVASYIEFIGGIGNQPSQACVQNCLFNTGSGMSWGVSLNRQWQSSGRSTGEFCADNTAVAQSIDDPSCPAGEMLNASGVCTPLAMCPYDASIYAINVNCHPALCAADASLYASSPLCPQPPASAVPVVVDCAVTPNDPICAGAVSGVAPIVTGTPGVSGVYQAPTMAPLGISGGTQNGDVNIENCMMNSGGGVVCVGDTGGVELDAVADSVPLGDLTVDIGTITPVLVGSSGGCPAPSPMVLHGQTYYFDWTTYCNFAAWIKPLLLAFSWLAAAGILVGGFVA